MPTFLDWTEAEYPEMYNRKQILPLAGESFAKVLNGDKTKRDKPLFWQLQNGKAVRKDNFRLVWESNTVITQAEQYAEGPDDNDGHWALYDMSEDKTETNNVACKYKQKVSHMKQLYQEWEKEMEQHIQLETEEIRR